jgi:hypothetical protein
MLTQEQELMFNELVKLTQSKNTENDSKTKESIESQILLERKKLMSSMGFSEYIKFMAYAGILLT